MHQAIFYGVLYVVLYAFFRCLYAWILGKYYTHWSSRKIPHLAGEFPFGNFRRWVFQATSNGELYRDICRAFPEEPLIGVYKLTKPELIVQCPELIKRVLVSNFHHYRDRQNAISQTSNSLSLNLFHFKYDLWKAARQKITPVFTTTRLKNMFNLICETGVEFAEHLRPLADRGRPLEFHDLMALFMTDVVGSCIFGVKMNAIGDPSSPFRTLGRDMFKTSTSKHIKYMVRSVWPALFKLFNVKTLDPATENKFKTAIKEILRERESSGVKRHDFIDIILDLKRQENANERELVKYDDNFIAAQAFSFFTAGYESSASLMAFTLLEIAKQPEIQAKVHEEIDRVCGAGMTYESMAKLTYLEMVIDEASRKYPAVGFLMRKCTKTDEIPASVTSNAPLTIEEGTDIVIPVLALHYDEKYFPDPERFIPERFSPEAAAERHPMAYLPFGEGPHNCVGIRLGKLQSKMGLLYLLKDFSVEPCEKTADKIELNPTAIVTVSKDGIWLNLKKRK